MIDTISFFIPKDFTTTFNFNALESQKTIIPHVTGEAFNSGFIKNFQVRQLSNGVFISGSIAKYIFDENLTIPTLSQIKKALKQLSKSLNFNLNLANVKRVDIGYNFKLDHKVKDYLHEFGDLTLFKKSPMHDLETLLYSTHNNKKQLLFYHKLLEMKHNHIPIPQSFKGQEDYILRYELRLNKIINNELGINDLTLDMLYDTNFLEVLIERWHYYYHSIHKAKRVRFSRYAFKTPLTLKDTLASIGLSNLGYDFVLDKVEGAKEHITKANKTRLKTMLKELSTNTFASYGYPLMKELDEKVDEVYNTYLTS